MIKHLGTNGIFIFTGVPGRKGAHRGRYRPDHAQSGAKNQVVFGTVNAGRDSFENSIRDIGIFAKRWPAAVRSLISGRFPMDAYGDLLLGRVGGIKNVIQLN